MRPDASAGARAPAGAARLPDSPLRAALTHEVHARPFDELTPPLRVERLVCRVEPNDRQRDIVHLSRLAREHGLAPPEAGDSHFSLTAGPVRVRWERHTEFVTYTFIRALREGEGEDDAWPLVAGFDAAWLADMPGERLSLQRVRIGTESPEGTMAFARGRLRADSLVGSVLGDGRSHVITDLRMGHDSAVHYLMGVEARMSERRLGRQVQSLLEIETYRMMALLGLPVAREAASRLAEGERELAELAESVRAAGAEDAGRLLEAVTRRATDVEALYAASHTRLSASAAYFALVQARLEELRESPVGELQSLGGFLHRRLTPARDTCRAVAARLEGLSTRVTRVASLLRTRVELEQLRSQNALLETMTRRQELQLKLQSTVEGLSVVAITYYGASLAGLLAKGARDLGWPLSAEATAAWSVPVIAIATWLLVRRLHHRVRETLGR